MAATAEPRIESLGLEHEVIQVDEMDDPEVKKAIENVRLVLCAFMRRVVLCAPTRQVLSAHTRVVMLVGTQQRRFSTASQQTMGSHPRPPQSHHGHYFTTFMIQKMWTHAYHTPHITFTQTHTPKHHRTLTHMVNTISFLFWKQIMLEIAGSILAGRGFAFQIPSRTSTSQL